MSIYVVQKVLERFNFFLSKEENRGKVYITKFSFVFEWGFQRKNDKAPWNTIEKWWRGLIDVVLESGTRDLKLNKKTHYRVSEFHLSQSNKNRFIHHLSRPFRSVYVTRNRKGEGDRRHTTTKRNYTIVHQGLPMEWEQTKVMTCNEVQVTRLTTERKIPLYLILELDKKKRWLSNKLH